MSIKLKVLRIPAFNFHLVWTGITIHGTYKSNINCLILQNVPRPSCETVVNAVIIYG